MKNILICLGLAALLLVAVPAQAHRFSTSWLQLSSGEDHPAEFDWSWLVVEHDLAIVAPFLVDSSGQLLASEQLLAQQTSFGQLLTSLLAFNADCSLEVLPVVHLVREVYAGQQSVRIYGHGGCPLASLQQVSMPSLFLKINDHKVIIELTDTAQQAVLSQAQPQWLLVN
jgi:hypothetical protein